MHYQETTTNRSAFRKLVSCKRWLLGCTILLSGAAMPAVAQAQQSPAADEGVPIVVTGSRVVRDGSDAPTPLSVISQEEIEAEAPANIADFVNTLPSVNGSTTPVVNSGSLSNAQSGISAIDLRNLGEARTLVLLDGQRSVGSTSSGLVDINTFPQALIERVEVVTGGASSVYGSDAVSGVVNFVLDKDFNGIEASYEYGVTTYSDVPNHLVQLTAGTDFADGRGNVVVSGEYFHQTGNPRNDRDWNQSGFFQINNPFYAPGNGEPFLLVSDMIGSGNLTPGGLITDGPFRGTYFGTIDANTGLASLGTLNFGAVSGRNMLGGDWEYASLGHRGSNSLANDEERIGIFGRADFDVTPGLTVFAQASYNKFEGESFYQQTPSTGVTIQLDNAFLPPDFLAMVADYNASLAPGEDPIDSITIGTSNSGIPPAGGSNTREVQRYVVGAEGFFELGGFEVDWNTYYQHGVAKTDEMLINTWLNSRLDAQTDAIFDPGGSGEIVCRVNVDADPTNDLPGCVPLNRLGVDAPSQQAVDYLFEVLPSRNQTIKQDVVALNFSTDDLFSTWDGPVGLAIGGEYRKDSVDGEIDDINLQRFLYGNYRVTTGEVSVYEAYVETLVPLGFGLEFNGAARLTDYSTSGTVTTWKAGLSWQPIDDIRFRGTLSRDIRAPNLLEIFDAGTARTNSVNVPQPDGSTVNDDFVQNLTGGGAALNPEKADTFGIGVVLTPTFLPGFTMSVDYFDIEVTDAIGFVTAQQTVDLCFERNVQQFCDNINYVAGSTDDIDTIDLPRVNFSSQKTRGIDIEGSFRTRLGDGDITLRALGTYTIENVTDNGFEGGVNDIAGVNDDGQPTFTYRVSAGYSFDSGFSALIVGRGFSDGVYDNDYIECVAPNCPASGPVVRTINENDIDGILYFDTNFTYDFMAGPLEAQALFSVKNVFDRDPVLVGNIGGNNTTAYPQTARTLYDTLGRTFRLGLRVKY